MGCEHSVSLQQTVSQLQSKLQNQRKNIKTQGSKKEQKLVEEFKKSPQQRDKEKEQKQIQQLTKYNNKLIICSILQSHCQNIQKHKQDLFQNKIKQSIIEKDVRTLIYCKDLVKLSQMDIFAFQIKNNFRNLEDLKPQQVDYNFINQCKACQIPTKNMMNQYILQLCAQQSLSLNNINEVGHNFQKDW